MGARKFAALRKEDIEAAQSRKAPAAPEPVPIIPVPDDAPAMDFEHRRFGRPQKTWAYRDSEGRLLGYICRWELPGEDEAVRKEVRPVTYCELGDGTQGWRSKGIPAPRPLFDLPDILGRPGALVIITEGEKTCEAVGQLFPEMVATTTMFGAQSPKSTDFKPLAGRIVIIAPDHDDAGRTYSDSVFELLSKAGAAQILHLKPEDIAAYIWRDGEKVLRPGPIPDGWDLADAVEDGWTAETLQEHLHAGDLLKPYQPTNPGIVMVGRKFRLTERGLEYLFESDGRKGEEPTSEWFWLCTRLEIVAHTRNPENEDWGLLLRITDADGRTKDWVIPRFMLADEGLEYRRHLLGRGLMLASGEWARHVLHTYLVSANPNGRMRVVQNTGWIGTAFVLPDRTIGSTDNAEPILYQRPEVSAESYATSGSLEAWKENVAQHASGNSRLALALSAAFVGPLLELTQSESGGFHLRGPSSIGKTTALLIAGSAWGGNRFPANWRATTNGLEGIAASRSDTLLILDEIGQCSPRDVGEAVYMLGNGVGKQRANRSGEARPPKRWRTCTLSTGEISIADKVREDSRTRQSKAGQEVRFVDIPADAERGLGVFETLHDFPSAEALARHLKDACAQNHGFAGIAYLEKLVAGREEAVTFVKVQRDAFFAAQCPARADGQVQRVAVRFGLVAAAGELAISYGILPWPEGEAVKAAATCFKAWIEARGGTEAHEERVAVEQVRHFIELHGASRFEVLKKTLEGDDEKKVNIRDKAGYRVVEYGKDDVFCIFPEVWRREVCKGLDPKQVASILAKKGMLNVVSKGRYERQRRVPGSKNQLRFYEVNSNIFEQGGDDEPETDTQETRTPSDQPLFSQLPRQPAENMAEQILKKGFI